MDGSFRSLIFRSLISIFIMILMLKLHDNACNPSFNFQFQFKISSKYSLVLIDQKNRNSFSMNISFIWFNVPILLQFVVNLLSISRLLAMSLWSFGTLWLTYIPHGLPYILWITLFCGVVLTWRAYTSIHSPRIVLQLISCSCVSFRIYAL